MRRKLNQKTHEMGEKRITEGFLFLPFCINEEWRWLEHAKVEECVCGIYRTGNSQKTKYNWTPIRWVNN